MLGAQTRPQPVRWTPHPFNTNADIAQSTPSAYRQFQSQRCTDCLNPDYKLPTFTYEPPATASSSVRDSLWTLPQDKWRPATRNPIVPTDAELYGRDHLFRKNASTRPANRVSDITGPQFSFEAQRWRKTDPLTPQYVYDGAPIDAVQTHIPRYGSRYPRSEREDFALRTDDITTEKIFNREYPKVLIKTRASNRTDDILGAQADTRCSAPKLWKIKDPSLTSEKLTNRVIDIEGAMAGTGGAQPPLYRTRKQAAAIAAATAPRGFAQLFAPPATAAARTPPPSASVAAARAADIASVHALK